MPKGPRGEKRPADVIGNAVMVAKIATGEFWPHDRRAMIVPTAELARMARQLAHPNAAIDGPVANVWSP